MTIVVRNGSLTQAFLLCHNVAMTWIIVGLGNPGDEYAETRHNTGRMVVSACAKAWKADDFMPKKIHQALVTKTVVGKTPVTLVLPETFMNKSGESVVTLVKSAKAAEKTIVVYDDFQLPLGVVRISFNRSSGGHNGVQSVIDHLKTEAFVRVRMGVAPATAQGSAKVPHGEAAIEKFILGPFKPADLTVLKKAIKVAIEGIELIIGEGREKAMSVVNGK